MLKTIKLNIDNMSCSHCIVHIQNLLEEVSGIIQVKNVTIGKAKITVNQDFNENQLIKKFSEDGIYKITSIS